MSHALPQTIGIGIAKAALDCHVHPAGIDRQFPNTAKGHTALIAWTGQWKIERIAYEATGTYRRALEVALADPPCVKLNPERARRFAQATGTPAETDRIDAHLPARMAVAPQSPVGPARSPRQNQLAQLVNARDGLVRDRAALKNRAKNLTGALLKRQRLQRLDRIARHIDALDAEIAADATLVRRHAIPTSIAGLGTLTANRIIATLPELVAARFNPDLKARYQQLVAAGKPAKIAITAVMRKRVVTANALLKADPLWTQARD